MSVLHKKSNLPTIHDFNLDIDLDLLRSSCNELTEKFVDVRTANPMLCMNHEDLVKDVYDNFEQINLTTPSEILPHTASIKDRLKRREEHLYNVPTKEYTGSYFEEIANQFECDKMRIRITKLDGNTDVPMHIDYDPTYATRVVIPVYTNEKVINGYITIKIKEKKF